MSPPSKEDYESALYYAEHFEEMGPHFASALAHKFSEVRGRGAETVIARLVDFFRSRGDHAAAELVCRWSIGHEQ